MTKPLLTCRQVLDFLAAYLDGALSADERSEFERHLRVCPPCVAYLDGYRETIRLERDALRPEDAPPAEPLPEELVTAVLASRRRP